MVFFWRGDGGGSKSSRGEGRNQTQHGVEMNVASMVGGGSNDAARAQLHAICTVVGEMYDALRERNEEFLDL